MAQELCLRQVWWDALVNQKDLVKVQVEDRGEGIVGMSNATFLNYFKPLK